MLAGVPPTQRTDQDRFGMAVDRTICQDHMAILTAYFEGLNEGERDSGWRDERVTQRA